MKHMRSTWNLFALPLGYLAVIIPEFERSRVTPLWEMKHGRKLSGQTVYFFKFVHIFPKFPQTFFNFPGKFHTKFLQDFYKTPRDDVIRKFLPSYQNCAIFFRIFIRLPKMSAKFFQSAQYNSKIFLTSSKWNGISARNSFAISPKFLQNFFLKFLL